MRYALLFAARNVHVFLLSIAIFLLLLEYIMSLSRTAFSLGVLQTP